MAVGEAIGAAVAQDSRMSLAIRNMGANQCLRSASRSVLKRHRIMGIAEELTKQHRSSIIQALYPSSRILEEVNATSSKRIAPITGAFTQYLSITPDMKSLARKLSAPTK